MENGNTQLSRKERERLYKRQEIIVAARAVFAIRGFAAATLDEIAERAEFGKGTLYSYFESKEELFETVIADIFDEFVSIAADSFSAPARGLEERYMTFARDVLRHLFEHYGIYFLMVSEMHKMHHQSHFATIFPDLLLILAEPFKDAMPKRIQRDLPPEQLGFMFLTMLLSLFRSSMHFLGVTQCASAGAPLEVSPKQIDESIERCLRTLEQVFFHGVLSVIQPNTTK
ncbi:MAG: TetR/AcrR family transcriptional regulator [Bacteroidota bacterium]|jgi:AcrR family transcriptional regulator|nr:TetR/AcrR family transcriptional regulator [Bacteroidota bacterium]